MSVKVAVGGRGACVKVEAGERGVCEGGSGRSVCV